MRDKTFQEAVTFCQTHGAAVPALNSEKKLNAIKNFLNKEFMVGGKASKIIFNGKYESSTSKIVWKSFDKTFKIDASKYNWRSGHFPVSFN